MDINKLKTFLKVAQYGSFNQVSENDFISQRAVSKQITQLETELGVSLFDRHTNRITLTPQGKFFLASAQDIINNYSEALSELSTFNQHSPQVLRIGYFSAFEQNLIRDTLFQMKRNNPSLHLVIREESNEHLTRSVKMGNLDAALSINYGQHAKITNNDLTVNKIFQGEMVMGISTLNPLSKQKCLHPNDLKGKDILYYSPESSTYLLESFLASVPDVVDSEQVKRVTSIEQMNFLVSIDQALAFYPAGLLDDSFLTTENHIRLLPLEKRASQNYEIVMMSRSDNKNPMLRQILMNLNNKSK